MQIHNHIDIYGIVRDLPKRGKTNIMCPVSTIRGIRDQVSQKVLNQYKYCTFYLISKDNEMIEKIKSLKPNDVVRVTGIIQTISRPNEIKCPNCNAINNISEATLKERAGNNLIYVIPYSVTKVASYDDQMFAYQDVIKNVEISNKVFLIGTLLSDPEKHELVDKVYTRYQIAVEHTDSRQECFAYPWIYSYGENAERDFFSLQAGSKVFIDGAMQTRRYRNKYLCKECKKEFEIQGKTLEVISYATEFL